MNLDRLRVPLLAAASVGLVVLVVLALVVAPTAARFSAPLTQRIFYFHVPAAAAGYLAFAVTLAASVEYLRRGGERSDRWAAASAEVGVVLTSIALFTGAVWSRVEFFSVSLSGGDDFAFRLLGDAKFVTTGALWLTFLGYLALRRSVDDPDRRARLSAVFGVLGFVGVPLSYLASRFSPHPDFLQQGSGLSPGMGAILGVGMLVFVVVYAALVVERFAVGERIESLRQERARQLAVAEELP
ncbi:MAG TPA: cytochrome c biogenesis protein [Candidatus Thermoplasmatota archaeon]|nr:cytochrome c biogenesis protein [Candidatus Thermoplasmatota archaeon]